MTDESAQKLLQEAVSDLVPNAWSHGPSVATLLWVANVRGTRAGRVGVPFTCPVCLRLADVLRTHFPPGLKVAAMDEVIAIGWDGVGPYSCRQVVSVSTPKAVADFLARFDRGEYPWLEVRTGDEVYDPVDDGSTVPIAGRRPAGPDEAAKEVG